ncbi:hypothetical protein [Streptomyces virginiae]|uniref:hypothetical protein n=1 Tax=Streptomyces virginiae TaxID=1961 RepID=UPI0036F98904
MIYGMHRAKGAPALGSLPGQDGPSGRRPAPDEGGDTTVGVEEPTVAVPASRNGSGG